MSPQEEILTQVKYSIENCTELATLVGGTPNVFFSVAEEDTPCPFFIYDLPRPNNTDTAIWEGELFVKLWFYATDSADAYTAEDILVRLFNMKIINGTYVKACRIWLSNEGRTQGIKKDGVMNFDAIFIRLCFDCRWCFSPRIASAEFTP